MLKLLREESCRENAEKGGEPVIVRNCNQLLTNQNCSQQRVCVFVCVFHSYENLE